MNSSEKTKNNKRAGHTHKTNKYKKLKPEKVVDR
jgi:hypothetical protein